MLLQDVRPWTFFGVRVHRVTPLTPHLLRVTFTAADPGDDCLARFADAGADTRVKLLLPAPDGSLELATGDDWYAEWRDRPEERRPVLRTYTVRAVRPATSVARAEVDVDLVLHGTAGPASRWACGLLDPAQQVAREIVLLGPNAEHPGPWGGREWRTPARPTDLLLAGDETALPAIAVILSELPAEATGTALLEVPTADDVLELAAPPGVQLRWLPREGAAPGSLLTAAALAWSPGTADAVVADVEESDDEVLWDVPETGQQAGVRAWVAGEAGAVRAIRRHLVGPCGLARSDVAFMGYWRLGRSES